jgi:iron-sulfur cluster assembly accessory protein
MMRQATMNWRCLLVGIVLLVESSTSAFVVRSSTLATTTTRTSSWLSSSPTDTVEQAAIDYEGPEDAVVVIKPNAMKRLRELKIKEKTDTLILRMGVRNGGCSGLSYVMDFSTEDAIEDDDAIDEYPGEQIKCVVDAKSMLYLYGLELDYSEELIGGGFKFYNPNAEESCGCGSSFGV